jgi:5-methylcytosine-specific restriction endonuclease McrA
MKHRDKILELRAHGKTYNEISAILGCSKSTVCYHCGKGQKDKKHNRTKVYLKNNFLLKKVSVFRNVIHVKSRDFQRRIDGGRLDSKQERNFTAKDVLVKLGENPKCYLSGIPIDLGKLNTYQFDHIVPVAKGGSNELSNLGLLCRQVNVMKSDLTVDEFLEWCVKILRNNGYSVLEVSTEKRASA